MCKYVRREIRDLSDEDRGRYFSALEIVYNTSLEEGVALLVAAHMRRLRGQEDLPEGLQRVIEKPKLIEIRDGEAPVEREAGVAEAMADGAVAAGLPRALAHRLTHRTMAGTAALLQDRQLHPAELKDMVSSPAGTTIAGLRALEQSGLRSALVEAVIAAAERSRELA